MEVRQVVVMGVEWVLKRGQKGLKNDRKMHPTEALQRGCRRAVFSESARQSHASPQVFTQ